MQLKLHNIGMLEHAKLHLHPLCVIAGENDNGKSTVGKIVFCIIKAINRYKEDLQESKESRLQEKADELFFSIRRALSVSHNSANDENRELFIEFRESLTGIHYASEREIVALETIIQRFLNSQEVSSKNKDFIYKQLEEMTSIISEPEDKRNSIVNAFKKVFVSEFDASLLLHGTHQGSIELWENEIKLIHLEIKKNSESGNLVVELKDDPEPLELKDVTFIETPLILNFHNLLYRSHTLLDTSRRVATRIGLPYTTLHTKDLFDKLREPALPADLLTAEKNEISRKLQSIIHGEISYSSEYRDFVFQRGQDNISIKNTASGIKVFGLLQMLLANEIIGKQTMLVFDEPENHLHPKWQLKLAEFLVYLAGKGVYILISSHSPYIIEALKRYADRDGVEHAFYLAKNRCIEDKNELDIIFQVLAEPFEVFRKMDEVSLKDE